MHITSFEEYQRQYKLSVEDPEKFWSGIAENFSWRKKWERCLEWNFDGPDVKWFAGGRLNITENCLDRHLLTRGSQPALIWEPNNPEEQGRTLTYSGLYAEVCRLANVLKRNGIQKGDRVCIYMPMVPELAIALLACARIGAIHSVVFGGFSFQSLSDRINDAGCRLVLTADGAFRGGKDIPLKPIVDEALKNCPTVEKVMVLKRTGIDISLQAGRDAWWEDELKDASPECPVEEMESEDMIFILYTSGSTGKPKVVVHTTA